MALQSSAAPNPPERKNVWLKMPCPAPSRSSGRLGLPVAPPRICQDVLYDVSSFSTLEPKEGLKSAERCQGLGARLMMARRTQDSSIQHDAV